jgi:catechol 2,3-dioxygenase-like lactoylglutathione lyase family enzyme
MSGPIGRLHHLVIDGPDPSALAGFYSALLGLPVTYRSPDWVVIAENDTTSGIAFQRAPDHQPPEWRNPGRPQQMHLDVMVDNLDAADRMVLGLGARRLWHDGDPSRVYADPAGHPFCLIPRPGWAPPVGGLTGQEAVLSECRNGQSPERRGGDPPAREGWRRAGL